LLGYNPRAAPWRNRNAARLFCIAGGQRRVLHRSSMSELDNPAVQGGLAPLVVALVIGIVLGSTRRVGRTPVAWLAVLSGYLASTWLATGIAFSPLTSTRKILLIVVVAALAGLVADIARANARRLDAAFAVVGGVAAAWAFQSILVQREAMAAIGMALGIAAYAGTQTWLLVQHRADGLRTAAIGVGLGIATGAAAVISASIGFLLSGVSVAAGAGALLLVQVLGRRHLPSGYTGTVAVGLGCALFALGAMLLAEMPWFVLPLLLLVPLGARAFDPVTLKPMARASALVGICLVLGLVPVAAAWFAARASST
jgi:hypothetical protein